MATLLNTRRRTVLEDTAAKNGFSVPEILLFTGMVAGLFKKNKHAHHLEGTILRQVLQMIGDN